LILTSIHSNLCDRRAALSIFCVLHREIFLSFIAPSLPRFYDSPRSFLPRATTHHDRHLPLFTMTRATRARAEVASTQSIGSFTRVTKSLVSDISKKIVVSEPVSQKKRKATTIDHDEAHVSLTRRNASFFPSSDDDFSIVGTPKKRACRRQEPSSTPAAVTPKSARLVSKGRRNTKAASSTTETAESKSQGKPAQTKLDFSQKSSKTAEIESAFPPHLAELLGLHKAFLSTIILQFVHHGNSVPLDVSSIAPHISRAWGKRAVTVEDIRRCVAIQSSKRPEMVSPFIVSDYGRGKVCVELRQGLGAASIKEDQLCKQFEDNLRAICAENATNTMTDMDLSFEGLSLADLPQADITTMGSSIKMHPAFAMGQRALSDLKSERAARQQEKEAKQQAPSNPLLNPDGTKMSLLDRIRYKQLAKAGEPLPPSGPELQRRAALNRVVDVAATISMLSLSGSLSLPRQAFTMAALTEKLKDSLRVPLSKEEGMACVRLIAAEVAPEWLRVVTVGGRENVVVQRNSQPVDRVIQERVQKLLS
jgi:hypothetical protein